MKYDMLLEPSKQSDSSSSIRHHLWDGENIEAAQLLIRKDSNWVNDKNSQPLYLAILKGSYSGVEWLLKHGAAITEEVLKTALNICYATPLSHSFSIVQMLIQHGGCNNGTVHAELLYTAIMHQKIEFIELLSRLEIDWNYRKGHREKLIFWAMRRFPQAIPMICKAGANINQINKDGLSLMHLLVQDNGLIKEPNKRLKELYELNADPTIRMPGTNMTPFQWAYVQNKIALANSIKAYTLALEHSKTCPINPLDTIEAQVAQISEQEVKEKIYLLRIAKFFARKARELAPFSTNQPKGVLCKKKILLQLVRSVPTPSIKQYYNLELDPNIDTPDDQPIIVTDLDGNVVYKTLSQIFAEIIKLPERDPKKVRKDGSLITAMEFFEKTAKNTVRHGVGNCFELATIIIMLINEYKIFDHTPIRYELLGLKGKNNGDHAFIVFNRAAGSQLNNMKSWGNYATICDPWFEESMNVSEQLQLDSEQQTKSIQHYLKFQNHISFMSAGETGRGHSKHWQQKHGTNPQCLFINRRARDKKENITTPYPVVRMI